MGYRHPAPLVPLEPAQFKNQDGRIGPICAYCGGYGFTNSMQANTSSGCRRCSGTGVEPPDIYALAKDVQEMKATLSAILEALKERKA